jgi:hypothetical protein
LVLEDLIKTIESQNLKIQIIHFGSGDIPGNSKVYRNFQNYDRESMLSKLKRIEIDLAFLPFLKFNNFTTTRQSGLIPENIKKLIYLKRKRAYLSYKLVFK